ncbi:MAG: lamin tail domain-containing protein, partial [Mariniphaga sp.]|nr:lamin tail domain-containing protein [Mariniphaga sp.]
MRLKLLLLLMTFSSVLFAQEPYRHLVITEARKDNPYNGYLELTNMGDQTINLNNFKFGKMEPWGQPICDVYLDPWDPGDSWFYLPEYMLAPGESYVIAYVYDFGPRMYRNRVPGFADNEREKITEIYDLANLLIHKAEWKGDETDSVTTFISDKGHGSVTVLDDWRGRAAWYIEQQLSESDSIVIDQVGGVFDDNCTNQDVKYSVAGVFEAVDNSILVRKYSVKTGNLDFANAKGVGLEDSEWIPIPKQESNWRKLFWTVGNHGDYVLDENTLESAVVDVDFAGRT